MIAALKAERNAVWAQMEAVGRRAEEGRLTPADEARYAELEAQYDELTRQIETHASIDPSTRILPGAERVVATERRFLGPDDRLATGPAGYSLGAYLRGRVLGDWGDVPAEARALGVGSGGSSLVPQPLAREVLDLARAATVAIAAGVTTARMEASTLTVPRLTKDPVAAWRDEHAAIAADAPTFDGVTLASKSLAVLVRVSRELLADAPLSDRAIRRSITMAMGGELDRAILAGAGVAPEPAGILNQAGVLTHATPPGETTLAWSHLIEAVALVRTQNRQPTAAIMHPSRLRELMTQSDTTGAWLGAPGYLAGVQFFETATMPTDKVIVGQMDQVLLGLREELGLFALTERYADVGEVGLVAHIRADVALADPQAVCVVTVAAA